MQIRNQFDLVHAWAHQLRPRGKASAMSFEGPVLRSYAEPIALLLGDNRVLLSSSKFSITTSSHQSAAAGAVSHMQRVYAPHIPWGLTYLSPAHQDNHRAWLGQVEQALVELALHPRRKLKVGRAIASVLQAMQTYSDFFNLAWDVSDERVRHLVEDTARGRVEAARAAEALAEERRKRRLIDQAEKLEAWRNGENHWGFEATALRLKDGQIETTKGARIPAEHAVKVWPLLKRLHDRGETYRRNGHTIHLGPYPLDSFDGKTLHAGCHAIPWTEIERMRDALGLT